MAAEHAKRLIEEAVDRRAERLIAISDAIWDCPEGGFQEFQSVNILIKGLEEEGFAVTRGLDRMDTAFQGVWDSGHPVVGILGEFDALPGLSQQAGRPEKCPVKDGGYGHGCGHNLLGAGTLAAAIAIKEYLKESGRGR